LTTDGNFASYTLGKDAGIILHGARVNNSSMLNGSGNCGGEAEGIDNDEDIASFSCLTGSASSPIKPATIGMLGKHKRFLSSRFISVME
jgi:hypothetical protein